MLSRAHPRSRGEHRTELFRYSVTTGSSPLARGTLPWWSFGLRGKGLIPARAGNTDQELACSPVAWAHPRSRGEHALEGALQPVPTGSSPLARGTRSGASTGASTGGLIPARAGNTRPSRYRFLPERAHPRSRGEHMLPVMTRPHAQGSSPLARGTPSGQIGAEQRLGLIPARAGNTLAIS